LPNCLVFFFKGTWNILLDTQKNAGRAKGEKEKEKQDTALEE